MLADDRIKHIKHLAEGTAQTVYESLLLGSVDALLAEREEMQIALAGAAWAFELTLGELGVLGPDESNPPEKVAQDMSRVRTMVEMCVRLAGTEAMAKVRAAVGLVEGAQ